MQRLNTLDLQLGMLRLAWRAAKTPEEKQRIEKHAALLKLPPSPEEDQALEKEVLKTVASLPDITHPHFDQYRSTR